MTNELQTVGAMHQCRAGEPYSTCVHCGALAEALNKPCPHFMRDAAQKLAAVASPTPQADSVTAPAGWKLLPVEPTYGMGRVWGKCYTFEQAYASLLAAAPTPPAQAADSVTAVDAPPSAASIAWNALRDLTDPLGEDGKKIMGHVRIYAQRQYEAGSAARAQADSQPAPINMVLHCPKCGLQHIDAPDERTPGWKNELHRSHLCHGCGHIWRPADVPTNGVKAVKTTGKADSPIAARAPTDSVTAPAGGADWQDISTAPKDGTRFVAVGQNYGLDSEAQHTCIAQWLAGCWVEVSDWNEASELKYLTHWMPLLPLPGSAARAPADSVLEDAARLLRQILAASQDGDSDTHLSAHFVSRIETITKAGGAA